MLSSGSSRAARSVSASTEWNLLSSPCSAMAVDVRRAISGAAGAEAFDAALAQAKVPHESHIYKGANHGFHNDTTPRYDEAAAKQAWQRTLDWFNKYLRS